MSEDQIKDLLLDLERKIIIERRRRYFKAEEPFEIMVTLSPTFQTEIEGPELRPRILGFPCFCDAIQKEPFKVWSRTL